MCIKLETCLRGLLSLNLVSWVEFRPPMARDWKPWASPSASNLWPWEALNSTQLTKFSHTTPCKHVSNILYSYDLSSNFALRFLTPIVIIFWYELTWRRVDLETSWLLCNYEKFICSMGLSSLATARHTLWICHWHCHWICHWLQITDYWISHMSI